MGSYQFLDAYSSILSADASVVGASTYRPAVDIGSVLSTIPISLLNSPSISGAVTVIGNPSVSGQLGASIIGALPAGNQIIGAVAASISGVVNIAGSVAAFQAGTQVTSLVSTVPSSVLVGASIFGQLPAGTAVLGSVAALQGTNPWNIAGSVAAFVVGNASVISVVPGSVAAVLLSAPSVYGNISGSVVAFQGAGWSGSVAAAQLGTRISSISGTVVIQSVVGTYAEDAASASADPGLFVLGVRNDTLASLVSAAGDYGGFAQDSQGRQIIKPFASEDATIISFTGSVVSASVTLIQASAIGKKSYITDFWVANSGATFQLITFQDGSTSVLGYAPAPATSGAMSPGIAIPLKTAVSQDLAFKATGTSSVVYLTVKGYQAP